MDELSKRNMENLSGVYEYELLGDGTVSIVSYKGNAPEIILPRELGGIQVSKVGDQAFSWCEHLTRLVIPEGIKYVGDYSFCFCQNLISVVFPDSLISIGNNAFFGCDSLPDIKISAGIVTIGERAFSSCKSFTAFHVSAKNAVFSDIEGVLFNKEKSKLCMYPCGKSTDLYKVSDGVRSIGRYAFYYCTDVKIVECAASVQILQEGAFYGSEIISIKFSAHVKKFGAYAFAFCKKLSSVIAPKGVTQIGDFAFLFCDHLIDAEIPEDFSES